MIVWLLCLAAVLGLFVLVYRPAWQAKWLTRVELALVVGLPVSELSKEQAISQDPGGGFWPFVVGTRTGPPGQRMMVRAARGAG